MSSRKSISAKAISKRFMPEIQSAVSEMSQWLSAFCKSNLDAGNAYESLAELNESNHAEFPNGETLSAGATALCSLFLETGELSRLINNIFRSVNAPSFFYLVGLIRELHWMFDDCPPYLTRIEWSVERTRKIDGDRKSVKMHAFRIIEEYNPSPERIKTASGIIHTGRETGFSCRQIRLDWPLFARIADFAVNHPEQFDDRLEGLFSGSAN